MRNKKSPWILVIFLLTGALIGGLCAELLAHNEYFSWLNLGGKKDLFSFALDPAIDLRILKFGFNLSFGINVGSIIGMIAGIFLYFRI